MQQLSPMNWSFIFLFSLLIIKSLNVLSMKNKMTLKSMKIFQKKWCW